MTTRRFRALLVPVLALSLAACGSSSDVLGASRVPAAPGPGTPSGAGSNISPAAGSASAGSTSTRSTSTGSSTSSTGSSGPADATELLATMRAATAAVHSSRFTSRTSIAGLTVTGSGAQKLERGKLVAFELDQTLPTGLQRILLVGGKSYLKQPGLSSDPARPYVLISTKSKNPVIRKLAGSLSTVDSSTGAAVGFLAAAESATREGRAVVAGQPTTRYRLVVDPSRLPAGSPNAGELQAAGLTKLPLDIWLDAKGRPVQTLVSVTVQGKTVSSRFVVTAYDGPVSIAAPPASQVTTG